MEGQTNLPVSSLACLLVVFCTSDFTYLQAAQDSKSLKTKSVILKDKQNRMYPHNTECAEMQQSSKQRLAIMIKEGNDRPLTSQPVLNVSGSLLPMK